MKKEKNKKIFNIVIIIFIVFLLQVDDQQVILIHVYSSNMVYNMIEDNENFDKTNQKLMNKMHIVRLHANMDQF